jgi:putative alpha-1,2-mannosidase
MKDDMTNYRKVILFFIWIHVSLCAQDKLVLVDYVNPFIGVDNTGNVFPGVTLPFGMVKLGPDCFSVKRWQSPNAGYESNSPVYGFGHTHVSGTDGGAKYGNITLMPIMGDVNRRDVSSLLVEEKASPGYFSAILNGKVLNRAWIKHQEILNGGVLVLEMSDKPSLWGT